MAASAAAATFSKHSRWVRARSVSGVHTCGDSLHSGTPAWRRCSPFCAANSISSWHSAESALLRKSLLPRSSKRKLPSSDELIVYPQVLVLDTVAKLPSLAKEGNSPLLASPNVIVQ